MVEGRRWWVILVLGLVALACTPLVFTRPSWKLSLAVVFASLLSICWVLLWLSIRNPRRWVPKVATVLGVVGGIVLGGLGAGLYCAAANCAAGFDALALLPLGALLGALVGGAIGSAVASRVTKQPRGPTPSSRPDGSAP
ncbi:MAG TPA: hypothetical protein VFT27_03930 [Actinomycetota bacterium]|nr:hypothetical protein [Actinomycetota bacterium]